MDDAPRARRSARAAVGDAGPYTLAFVAYVAIGIVEPRFLLNSHVGIVFCVVTAWGIPATARKLAGWLRRPRPVERDVAEAGQP